MKKRRQKLNKKNHNRKNYYPHLVFLTLLAVTILISVSSLRTNFTNFSRAQQANFHLTEELYGANTSDGINFNVHVKFNFDGCDGDIMLYEGDRHIAGPNGWKGPGNYDYNETWTASPKFIPNDGQPHSISYRGSVNRCPKSEGTLWEEISCSVTFDSQGYPQISPGDKCEIKNLSEIQPVPYTTPKPIVPTDIPPSNPTSPPNKSNTDNPIPAVSNIPQNDSQIPPSSTPGVEARENSATIIQFMGIKLGRLANTQPLNILWFIIDAFGRIFQAK